MVWLGGVDVQSMRIVAINQNSDGYLLDQNLNVVSGIAFDRAPFSATSALPIDVSIRATGVCFFFSEGEQLPPFFTQEGGPLRLCSTNPELSVAFAANSSEEFQALQQTVSVSANELQVKGQVLPEFAVSEIADPSRIGACDLASGNDCKADAILAPMVPASNDAGAVQVGVLVVTQSLNSYNIPEGSYIMQAPLELVNSSVGTITLQSVSAASIDWPQSDWVEISGFRLFIWCIFGC